MELLDPKKVRLLPGESMGGMFATGAGQDREVGIFLRSSYGAFRRNGNLIHQRAGLIHFNDVLLVLTMIKAGGDSEELFDIWWNYHSQAGPEHFKRMAEQERLVLYFYDDGGKPVSVETENEFRSFFASLPELLKKAKTWTEIEFDRAVRGFCSQSYPKENLWEMIQLRPAAPEVVPVADKTPDAYRGHIPEDLRPFYVYDSEKGHCIRIIPSMLEGDVMPYNAEDLLLPAPIKTVLRCGIRWVKGYPVAPIPLIPGHGLAVPPEDTEL
jgi:hypothetical protein